MTTPLLQIQNLDIRFRIDRKSEPFHAVKGISEELGGVALAGFETYGEIALDVGDMSGFHNTTSVVLAFPEG